MKTVRDYMEKGEIRGSRWLRRNPQIHITSVDRFLCDDWEEALSLVCKDNKVVGLVNFASHNRKKQIYLVDVLVPRGFLSAYFKHLGVCGADSEVYDCSALEMKRDFPELLDRVAFDHFVRVNAFQEKKVFLIAGGGLTAFTHVGADGGLALNPIVY